MSAPFIQPKWIRFRLAAQQKPKTKVWDVQTLDGSEYLGQVRWFSRWRRYAFYPMPDTVFESECLYDIARVCEFQSREQRIMAARVRNAA